MLTKPRTCVRMPARCLHDLRQRRTLRALYQRDDRSLLVGGTGRFACDRLGRFLGRLGLLKPLSLARRVRGFEISLGSLVGIDCYAVHWFLLDRSAVVDIHHSARKNKQDKSEVELSNPWHAVRTIENSRPRRPPFWRLQSNTDADLAGDGTRYVFQLRAYHPVPTT